jgi:hypothetical protein
MQYACYENDSENSNALSGRSTWVIFQSCNPTHLDKYWCMHHQKEKTGIMMAQS